MILIASKIKVDKNIIRVIFNSLLNSDKIVIS